MSAIADAARENLLRDARAERDQLRLDVASVRAAHESAEQDVRRLQAECERNVEQLNRERALRLRAEKLATTIYEERQAAVARADAAERVQVEGVHAHALSLLEEAQRLVEALRAAQTCEAFYGSVRCMLRPSHEGKHDALDGPTRLRW